MPVITFIFRNNGDNVQNKITRGNGTTILLNARGTPDRGEKQIGWRLSYPGMPNVDMLLDDPYKVDYNDVTFRALYETIEYKIHYVSRQGFWLHNANDGLIRKYNKYTNKVVQLPKMFDDLYEWEDWHATTKVGVNYRWYTNSTFTNEITSLDLRDRIGDITVYMYDTPTDDSVYSRLNMFLWYNEDDITLNMPPPWKDNGSSDERGFEGLHQYYGTNAPSKASKQVVDINYTLKPGRILAHVYGVGYWNTIDSKAMAPITGTVNPARFTIEGWGRGDYLIAVEVGYSIYTISYDLMGGTEAHGNPTTYRVISPTINLVQGTMTRAGYTFNGWYTAKTGGTKVTSIPKGSYGNKTYYARWSVTNYSITYTSGGSTAYPVEGDHGNPTSYNIESDTINLGQGTLSRPGWTFETWSPSTSIPKGSTGNKAFTANWSTNTYNVYNEGASQYSYKTSDNNGVSKRFVLSIVSEEGYIFQRWGLERQGDFGGPDPYMSETRNLIIPSGSYGDIETTSIFRAISYTVRFNQGVGESKVEDKVVAYDEKLGELGTPDKTGYIFTGWFDSEGEEITSQDDKLTTVHGSVYTLYAGWKPIKYKVEVKSFTDDWTEWIPPAFKTVVYDSQIGPIDLSTIPGYKVGYDYLYYVGNHITFKETDKNKSSVNNTTVYLELRPLRNRLTVNYDKGGDSTHPVTGAMTPSSVLFNASIGIKANGFNRVGYTFMGWKNSDLDAAHVNISAGDSYSAEDISSLISNTDNQDVSITLTAQWKVNQYTITFISDDGGNYPSKSYDYGTTADPFVNPVFNGFVFVGWYKDSSFTDGPHTSVIMPAKDVVMYAKWEGITYNITRDANGGAELPELEYTSSLLNNQMVSIPNLGRIESGMKYTFNGWDMILDTKGSDSGLNIGSLTIPKKAYGDVKVKAKWTAANRKIRVGNIEMIKDSIRFGTQVIKEVIYVDDEGAENKVFEDEES